MLREVGKRDLDCLRQFLAKHTFPRTTLRYAIERMDSNECQYWLTH